MRHTGDGAVDKPGVDGRDGLVVEPKLGEFARYTREHQTSILSHVSCAPTVSYLPFPALSLPPPLLPLSPLGRGRGGPNAIPDVRQSGPYEEGADASPTRGAVLLATRSPCVGQVDREKSRERETH